MFGLVASLAACPTGFTDAVKVGVMFTDACSCVVDIVTGSQVSIVNVNSISLEDNDCRAITLNAESVPFDGCGTGWTSGANGSTFTNGNYY